MATTKLKHASLHTTLNGLDLGEITQYRGVKFASIEARFERSVLFDQYHTDELDCTHHGPCCPQQTRDIQAWLRVPPQPRIPVAADEFECLNLIVNTPSISYDFSLPVMVYIHGGANIRGAGSDKFIDTSNLVRRSILMNKPIIIVSLNYRVNYLGFGWVKGGNNGLHDLVTGFHWIRKHIAGFGGDPDQITAVGESAGSAAVDALLQGRQERLFRRAVLQSGTVRACLPRSRAEHDAIIQDLCEFCDVDQSRQDWQTKLQVVPVHKLVEKLSSANFEVMPYADDGDFFNAPWQDRSAGWVDSIVVGDCGWESAVHTRWLPLWTATSLIQDFSSSQEHVATLMSTYNLTTDTTDEQAKQIGLDFLNDALFAYPAQAVAQRYRAASVPVYQYVFDQDNPFDPSLKAHHAVDLLFTFRAFDLSNAADATAEDLSTSVQEKWVTYASGESPWNQDTCHAFGPDGQMGPIAPEKLAERRRFAAYDVLSQIPVSELNNVVEHVMRFITCTN